MDEIIIKVSASDDGYHFYIYAGDDAYMECEEADGGLCTSTTWCEREKGVSRPQSSLVPMTILSVMLMRASTPQKISGCAFVGSQTANSRHWRHTLFTSRQGNRGTAGHQPLQ